FAVAPIVNVAVTVVASTTVTLLTPTKVPDTATIAPVRFVPVRVTLTAVPCTPEAGVMEFSIGPCTPNATVPVVPIGVATLILLELIVAFNGIFNVAVTVESLTTENPVTVMGPVPLPDIVYPVAPVK